jgi:tRNA threonylcarbamoyl adenosine modification protein YeaZ/ribosomal-protein-alanine acetyltransferase
MKLLAFDTSMAACSAAVSVGERVLAARYEEMATGQAEALAPMVEAVIREADLPYAELSRIAVTTGPGSFTGVRIGLSLARGLGVSLGLPIVGIDSLAAIACNEPRRDMPLAVIADARNNEVYAAVFAGAPEPRLTRREHLPELLTMPAFRMLGSGADAEAKIFLNAERSQAGDFPRAANFISLAARMTPGDAAPDPLYLRPPDVKPQHRFETLTHLSPASAALLAELHVESFPEGWSDAEFHKLFGAPGLEAVIIMHGAEPAGFAILRQAADEAEIITICVRPKLRRRGFGKLILQQAERSLSGRADHLFLEVNAANAAAIALYRRLGFSEAGRRPRYYQGRDDALIMRKEIGA